MTAAYSASASACEQLGLGEPGLHGLDAPLQGVPVLVALGDHPLHQGDVGVHVLDDRFLVQAHGAAGGRALGRGVGQLEGLLDLQVWAGPRSPGCGREKMFFLPFFSTVSRPCLDGVVGDGVDQVAQGDARLHLALEAHQHHSGMSSGMTPVAAAKATRPEPAGKEMPMGKRVWESPPVPTVSGSSRRFSQEWMMPSPGRRETPPRVGDEAAAGSCVRLDVHRLGIGGGVAERLHDQVGGEAQAGQVLQLVAGHGAGGVLGAHGGHLGLAIGAGPHALAFGQAAGAAHHLLGQGVALAGLGRDCVGRRNRVEGGRPRALRALAVRPRPMISGMRPPARTSSKSTSDLTLNSAMTWPSLSALPSIGAQFDHVAGLHLRDVQLDGQGAGVLHGVVEDRARSWRPGRRRRSACWARRGCPRRSTTARSWWRTCARSRCPPRRPHRPPGGPWP